MNGFHSSGSTVLSTQVIELEVLLRDLDRENSVLFSCHPLLPAYLKPVSKAMEAGSVAQW